MFGMSQRNNAELTSSLTSTESGFEDNSEWMPRGVEFLATAEVCVIRK